MEFFSNILEKFSNSQRLWALIILGVCSVSFAAIKITPQIYGNHNCLECRQDIRQCNRDYAELAATVREYIRIREDYVAERSFEAMPVESLPQASYDSTQVVESVPVEVKDHKEIVLDKMKSIALKNIPKKHD
jgi:hypothetical protein